MAEDDPRPVGARVTLDMVGAQTDPVPVRWAERDAMLYALGVGAALDDAERDLPFTTENSEGVALQAVPSFVTVLALGHRPAAVERLDIARLLHAEQRIELLRPLPPAGEGAIVGRVEAVFDKGADAMVVTAATLCDSAGDTIARSIVTLFVRGAGGFGGPRGSSPPRAFPDRTPDVRVVQRTRRDQALLYRLSGDRNPLHSDPAHARARGFARPILHGLCTYGFACRALVEGAANGDPARLAAMEGRLSKPVLPGETLTTEIWRTGEGTLLFRTLDEAGAAVLDRGAATLR